MVKYYKIKTSRPAAIKLAQSISNRLDNGKNVLWLLSGGTALDPAVEASKLLKGGDLSHLTISLVDERYGRPGHGESNWQKLIASGFEIGNAKLFPILSGESIAQTTEDYKLFLKKQFGQSDFKLALLGMGADGHTAGVLPGSPAVGSRALAEYYQALDFTRITASLRALALLEEALVYCIGLNKTKAINDLALAIPLKVQPAQVIKQIPTASVYNSVKGEEK